LHKASSIVLDGDAFQIPTDLKPEDLDWDHSRPKKPWLVRRGRFELPGFWELEWIELNAADVTRVLCTADEPQRPTPAPPSRSAARRRARPERERVERVLGELFPQGIPDQAAVPNSILCRRVGERLRRDGLPDVSNDTMLRAAKRRK
jgi:hypothetical protein